LRINLGKYEIVPIGEVEDVEDLAHLLGCRVASLPMKYLGFAVGCLIFGMELLRKWNVGWLVGRNFIYRRVVG